MAGIFIEAYWKYFLWNESLLKHFFGNESESEVVLNISAETLKEIAQNDEKLKGMLLKHPDSIIGDDKLMESLPDDADWYKERFYGTVELFCQYYNEYIVSCIKPGNLSRRDVTTCKKNDNCSNFKCISKDKRKDVLAVANHIIERKIAYYKIDYRINNEGEKIPIFRGEKNPSLFSLPCFAIAIYIIMKFDDGEEQKWENISDIDISSHKYIVKLWNSIHTYDNRFDSDATIYENTKRKGEDYVGRVKYHLPLSRKEIRLLKDAIYATGVWRRYDEMSFSEIILELSRELEYQGYEEWKKILGALGSNKVLQRKVEEQVELFNEDKYKEDRENRKRDGSVTTTKLRGEFVLGLYYPEDENEENKIVLLTTISEDLNISKGKKHNAYEIKGCGDEFYRNRYNRNFVKVNGADSLKIKDYSCSCRNINISQMEIGDVVFFDVLENENLYIQTREIVRSKSYVVAVKCSRCDEFVQRCKENNDTCELLEDTEDLYGSEWRVFIWENPKGKYFDDDNVTEEVGDNNNSFVEIKKGGIRDSQGRYFVNALPYIEVAESIDINSVNLCFGINNQLIENNGYRRINKGNKIIVDLDANINIPENSICSVTAEYRNGENNISVHSDYKITSQIVEYTQEGLHKYNKYAQMITDDNWVLQGNKTNCEVKKDNAIKVNEDKDIDIQEISSIDESFYFVNLLAACCFDLERSEITDAKFRRCVSYAATRLGVDVEQNDFIKNLRFLLSYAGIISVDYSSYKYQAIPPAFSKAYITNKINIGGLMLSGCYSRKFINDLLNYCSTKNIKLYRCYKRNKKSEANDAERFLPPIILIESKFNVSEFVKETRNKCDDLSIIDLPISIISGLAELNKEILEKSLKLYFVKWDADDINRLSKPNTNKLPRVRDINGNYYYIEQVGDEFSEINRSFLPWAKIYCGLINDTPIVSYKICNEGKYAKKHKLYVDTRMQLPIPILRSLYMIGLGMPDAEKVFICNNGSDENYYHKMNVYDCFKDDVCGCITNKLKGKYAVNSEQYSMELLTLSKKHRWSRKKNILYYLVLKIGDDIIAVAFGKKVYIRREERYYKIDGNMNEVFSYLIGMRWTINSDKKRIQVTANCGTEIVDEGYSYSTTDVIQFPPKNENDYTKENIEII